MIRWFFRAEPQGPFEMRKAGAATPGSACFCLQNGFMVCYHGFSPTKRKEPKMFTNGGVFLVPCVNLWSMFYFFWAPGHFL